MKTFIVVGIVAVAFVVGAGLGCGSTTTATHTVDISTTPRPTPDIEAEGPCPPRPDPDYISVHDFIPTEIHPELIFCAQPRYPRLAQEAGLEGTVWIQVCVGKKGSVLDAVLSRSSGTPTLDEAALQAAYWSKFKPLMINGRPLCTWTPYKIEFKLD